MCGIVGFYSPKFRSEDVLTMTNQIIYRGPDAGAIFHSGTCGLGHRRLSIIDLSEAANQPMTSHSGKNIMVFNGEIYNYQEVAARLKKENPSIAFHTHSDTEVILEAFEFWGKSFVNQLNGMFAIAIYNIEDRKLHLFRDRIGVKPLFVYHQGETIVFASELKAIVALLKNQQLLTINPDSVAQFLHLGYIPSPNTIYSEIKKFPQASHGEFDGNELKIEQWWSLSQQIAPTIIQREEEAKATLKSLLTSSVKYRMISDVPFGTFLSGGIDSSVVTAIAQDISDKPINTFSIGFDDAKHNEAHFAKKIAHHLGTNHHEYTLTQRDAIDLIPMMQEMYDEPYADSSAIPTFLVSKMAKQSVTMTLSGDGGDELFMGYGAYIWAKRLENPWVKATHHLLSAGCKLGNNKYKRIGSLLHYNKNTFMPGHLFSQEQYFFSWEETTAILKNERMPCSFSLFKNAPKRALTKQEQQSLFDLCYYLPDDLLVKVDRATMQNSLETRVPLLDYRIIEFALNLDPALKIKNNTSKYLLKQVLYDYIPATYFDRPKWGFSIPLDKWMKNELKEYIESYLFIENEFINKEFVEKLYSRFLAGETYLYQRIWAIFVINKFIATCQL